MAYPISFKWVRQLMVLLFAAALVASCASGDAFESAESLELAQRIPVCCNRACEDRGSCMAVSCGTSALQCCIYSSEKDGTTCTTPTNQAGECVSGQCCPCPGIDPLTRLPICNDCDDRNPCTLDGCERNLCSSTPVKDGEPCPSGVCIAGKCCAGCVDKEGNCRASGSGNPEFCGLGGGACEICEDDTNPCTDDVCVQGKCQRPTRPNGSNCDDGNVCNGLSTCQNGQCAAGAPLVCPIGNPCVSYSCTPSGGCVATNTTAACNDGNDCTVGDRCADGVCRPGTARNCDDNQVCTTDSCDPDRGGCVNEPVVEGTLCDDRNDCTDESVCNVLGRCVGTSGVLCEDENPCTIDGCNQNTNMCDFSQLEEAGTPCASLDKCILNASCDANGQCSGGEAKNCDDGNPCTLESCDPQTGECIREELSEGECNDDSVCTVDDRCEEGVCVGDPLECAAFDDCHAPGTCDLETGLCDDPRVPAGTECESGTGTCDSSGRCVANPVVGVGGAPSEGGAGGEEGGAPAEGGTPSAGGASGEGPTGAAGEDGTPEGGDGPSERGRPFVRDPGGCACGVPADSQSPKLPLLLVAALAALSLSRRRHTRASERRP